MASGSLKLLRPVAIDASPQTTLTGQLTAGDIIDLILSYTLAGEKPRSTTIKHVLVLDIEASRVLVLGMTPTDEISLEASYGSSRLLVVRTDTYTRP